MKMISSDQSSTRDQKPRKTTEEKEFVESVGIS